LTQVLHIGIFGGAFDPPHLAHRALAQAAIDQLKLEFLYIVPTGQAWHKSRVLSDAIHRLAMARLAFQNMPHVVVNDLETQREGASYTVDTLDELQLRHPRACFYVLVGADQAASFTLWHQWQRVLKMAKLVVVQRPVSNADQAYSHEWHNLPSERVMQMQMPLMDISSSALRASYASGHPKPELVSPLVAHYIQQNQLYLETHDRSR
jgi:nicotinate-nucleotide adenylyltransferase